MRRIHWALKNSWIFDMSFYSILWSGTLRHEFYFCKTIEARKEEILWIQPKNNIVVTSEGHCWRKVDLYEPIASIWFFISILSLKSTFTGTGREILLELKQAVLMLSSLSTFSGYTHCSTLAIWLRREHQWQWNVPFWCLHKLTE